MNNPNGPYPGRQLFLGLTKSGRPCLAYLVTGRSPQSRERMATTMGTSIIMGPIGDVPYDSLRHYPAIKYDNSIGLVAVSNGIQTEAIYETYRLLFNTDSTPGPDYLAMLMNGARSEPDSLHTPRIAGVISNPAGATDPVYIAGIKTHGKPAKTWQVTPGPGTLTGVSTYHGDMENPGDFNIGGELPVVDIAAETPGDIAAYIYEISKAENKGDDIRVCAVGGVRGSDNLTWELAMINRHKG